LVTNAPSWYDHPTGWTYRGKPAVLVAQPYGLCSYDLEDLTTISRDPRLYVRIEGSGWYGRGTVFIEIWREDAYEAIRTNRRATDGTPTSREE